MYRPRGHSWQPSPSLGREYLPGGHVLQAASDGEPVAAVNVPTGHVTHVVAEVACTAVEYLHTCVNKGRGGDKWIAWLAHVLPKLAIVARLLSLPVLVLPSDAVRARRQPRRRTKLPLAALATRATGCGSRSRRFLPDHAVVALGLRCGGLVRPWIARRALRRAIRGRVVARIAVRAVGARRRRRGSRYANVTRRGRGRRLVIPGVTVDALRGGG